MVLQEQPYLGDRLTMLVVRSYLSASLTPQHWTTPHSQPSLDLGERIGKETGNLVLLAGVKGSEAGLVHQLLQENSRDCQGDSKWVIPWRNNYCVRRSYLGLWDCNGPL